MTTIQTKTNKVTILLLTTILLTWCQAQSQAFPTRCEVGQPAAGDSLVTAGSVRDNYVVTMKDPTTGGEQQQNSVDGIFKIITGQTYDFQITAPTSDLNFMGYAIVLGTDPILGQLLPTTTTSGEPIPGGLCPSNVQSLTNTTSTTTSTQVPLETIQIQIQLSDTLANATTITLDVTLLLQKQEETNSGSSSSTSFRYYYSQFNLLAITSSSDTTTTTSPGTPTPTSVISGSSAVPSTAPSTVPSALPSTVPSALPSIAPTSIPTAAPIPATSIYDYITSSTNHQRWARAISKSNLSSLFSASNNSTTGTGSNGGNNNNNGGYTMFVPTDESINQWGGLDKLLQNDQWRYHLEDVVLFHTLKGRWTKERLQQQGSTVTISSINSMEETVTIAKSNDAITLNGQATLRNNEQIIARNGIVQPVDGVMMPVSQKGTVYEFVILGSGAVVNIERELTTLASLFTRGLSGLFQIWGEGPFTLFAPTDAAWAKMSKDEFDYLTAAGNENLLVDVLNYHIAQGIHAAADLRAIAGGSLPMANGKNAMVSSVNDGSTSFYTIDSANPIKTDILLKNGMVHLIDTVMVPHVTANLECVDPPPNVVCAPNVNQVICGHFVNCTYDNECLANAAGYQECRTPPPTSAPTIAPTVTPATTVWEVIEKNEETDQFQQLLASLNINLLLADSDEVFTVFAPQTSEIESNNQISFYQDNIDNWSIHLTHLLEEHIIRGSSFTVDELFSTTTGLVTSVAGEIVPIDTTSWKVGGHQIVQADLLALNGVVQVLKGVLGSTHLLSLVQLLERGLVDDAAPSSSTTQRRLQTSAAFAKLIELLQSTELINDRALNQRYPGGTTLISPVAISESVLSSDKDNTKDLLLYHILETNVYAKSLDRGAQLLLDTRHPSSAQVLVTVDNVGVLRFNEFVATKQILGQNGVLQVVDGALQPPSISELLNYSRNYTSLSVSIIDDLVQASGWASDEDLFVGNVFGSVTLLAPADESFNEDTKDRLTQPSWSLHLHDLLKNLLLPKSFSQQELQGLVETTTLAGTKVSLGSISTSMQATNGIIHLVNTFDAPQSMSLNVLDFISKNSTLLLAPIDVAGLSDTLSNQSPITFFIPPADLLESLPPADFRDMLENHIFRDILYAEKLVSMNGQVIKSVNGKLWVVEVLGESVFLKTEKDDIRTIPVRVQAPFDVLARNGVLHSIDGLLSDELASEAPSTSPTALASEAPSTSPTANPQPTSAPTLLGSVATINVTFVIYNTQGLTSTEVSKPEYAVGINAAFLGFVEALIENVEGKLSQRLLKSIVEPRQLLVRLATNSAIISGIRGQICPTNVEPVIPDNALCHLVNGRFNLNVIDESTADVEERYMVESAKALREGKLQEILEAKDPLSPFVVVQEALEETSTPTMVPRGSNITITMSPTSNSTSPSPSQAPVLASTPTITPSLNGTAPTQAPVLPGGPTSAPSVNETGPTQAPVLAAGPTSTPSANETGPTQTPILPSGPTAAPSGSATGPPLRPTSTPSSSTTGPTQTPILPPGPTSTPSSSTQVPSLPSGPTVAPSVIGTGPTQAPVLTKDPTSEPTSANATQAPFFTSNPTVAPLRPTIPPSINDSRPTLAPAISSRPTIAPSLNGTVPTRAPTPNATSSPSLSTLNPTSGSSSNETFPPATSVPTGTNRTLPPVFTTPQPTPSPTGTPTLVQINSSFLMYNTEGLTSKELSEPQNVVTLNKAWIDFCENLVTSVEGSNTTLTRRYLRGDDGSSFNIGRFLEVSLHPLSTAVYGVRDVVCPPNHQPPIPDNATCVDVYGKYQLRLTDDEDPNAIQEKYVDETEKALAEGKMQESLNRTDPNYPFIVFGPIDSGTAPPEPTEPPAEEDKKMEWWLILIIVLSSVLGLCAIGFGAAVAYLSLEQKQTTTESGEEQASKSVNKEDDSTEAELASEHPQDLPNTVIADYSYVEKGTTRSEEEEEDDEFEDEDDFATESEDSSKKEESLDSSREEQTTIVPTDSRSWVEEHQSTVVNIEVEELDNDDGSHEHWHDEDDDTGSDENEEWQDEDSDSDEEDQIPLSPAYRMPSTIVQDSIMVEDASISTRSTGSVDAPEFWEDNDSRTQKSEWIGDDATVQIAESFADAGNAEFVSCASDREGSDEQSSTREDVEEPSGIFAPVVEDASSSQEISVASIPVACDGSQETVEDPPMISKFGDAPSAHHTATTGIEEVGNLKDPSLPPGDDPSVAHSITSITYVRRDPSIYPGDDPSSAVSLMSNTVGPPLRDPSLSPGDDPSAVGPTMMAASPLLRDPSICPGGKDPSVAGSLFRPSSGGKDPSVAGSLYRPSSEALLEDPREGTSDEEQEEDANIWQDEEQSTDSSKITSGPASAVVSSQYAADEEESTSTRAPLLSIGESVATVFDEESGEAVETTAASTADPPLTNPTHLEDVCDTEEEIDVFCLSSSEESSHLLNRQDPPRNTGLYHIKPESDEEKKEVDHRNPNQPRRVSIDPNPSGTGLHNHGSLSATNSGSRSTYIGIRGEMDTSESDGVGWEDVEDNTDDLGRGVPSSTLVSDSNNSSVTMPMRKNRSGTRRSERRTSRRRSRKEKRGFLSSSSSSSSSTSSANDDSATTNSNNTKLEGEILVEVEEEEEEEETDRLGDMIGRTSDHSIGMSRSDHSLGGSMMQMSSRSLMSGSSFSNHDSSSWMVEDVSFHFDNQRRDGSGGGGGCTAREDP